ncbi:MAG: hypothetical protein GF418_04445 [Chitinivibrionales bacterium]|nr:hypothetical protein [Chitinivibrionales bacterium]
MENTILRCRIGSLTGKAKVVKSRAAVRLTLKKPRLWWPWPYGKPHLYTATCTLESGRKVVDRARRRFGVRSVRIVHDPLEDGTERWAFEINGRDIFVKGANWVPPRISLSDIDEQDYRHLLELARHGRIAMLRIWGGGIYEKDSFYDLCDEMGIMVFQDFMFACGMYPQSREFLSTVGREARYQVDRLASHPSIVVWSGGNENDSVFHWLKGDGKPIRFRHDRISRSVLPRAVREMDGTRPYIPCSPYNPYDEQRPELTHAGDNHEYTYVKTDPGAADPYGKRRSLYDFRSYEPRFLSEFGWVGVPNSATLARYDFFRSGTRLSELSKQIGSTEAVVDMVQMEQCHVVEYKIRRSRARKPACSGLLYWKFNDPFEDGVASGNRSWMSSVMYPQGPVPQFYVTRRAYADVIVAVLDEDERFPVVIVSDLDRPVAAEVHVVLQTLDGRQIHALRRKVDIAPDSVVRVTEDATEGKRSDDVTGIFAHVRVNSTVMDRHVWYPSPFRKLLSMPWPKSELKVKSMNGTIEIACKKAVARWVTLECTHPGVLFSDSAFDMTMGAVRRIEPLLTRGLRPSEILQEQVRIRAFNAAEIALDLSRLFDHP